MLNLISSDIKLLFKFKSTKIALLLSVGLSLISIFGLYVIINSGAFSEQSNVNYVEISEAYSSESITSSFMLGFQAGVSGSAEFMEEYFIADEFSAKFYINIFSGESTFSNAVLYALIPNDGFFLFLVIVCSIFIANSFKTRSILVPVSQGIPRYKVYLSKIISVYYVSFILACVNFFTVITAWSVVIGFTDFSNTEVLSLIIYFIFMQILYFTICAVLGMIAFVFRSTAVAMAINFTFIFGVSLTSIGFISVGGAGAYDGFNRFWLTFQCLKVLEGFPDMSILKVLPSFLVVFIYLALALFIGIRHFYKKDL